MLLVAAQLLVFSQLGPDSSFWALLPGLLLGGIGMPMTMTPSAAAATRGVPVEKAGVGSAVLNAARQVGGSIGIALLGAIMAAHITTPPTVDAFMDGFEQSLLVAAGIAIAAAVVAAVLIRPHDLTRGGRARRTRRRGRVSPTESIRGRRLPAEERRRAIVQAALRVFSAGSYAGATTAEIAREAGVTEPVLYRHFGSKRDLWAACLDAAWEEFREAFDTTLASMLATPMPSDDRPLPVSVARWRKALMPNLWMQGITEAGEDREIRKLVARHMRVVHDHSATRLRDAQASGLMPTDRDPDAEAWVMIAGGLLRSVADRLGGLLDDDDLAAIQRERMRWLLGREAAGASASSSAS